MADWVDDIKNKAKADRERAERNERAIKMYGGRLWDRFGGLMIDVVQRFNRGVDAVTLVPGDPLTSFKITVNRTSKRVTVSVDYDRAAIEYTYQNITNAVSGKFYLEANPDGSVLLICLGIPCDKSVTEAEAVEIALRPVLAAAV